MGKGDDEDEESEGDERSDNLQNKDDMFTRNVPFTSIWAIASWGRTYLDRLSSALSPFLSGSMNLHRRFRLIRADC
jgi:hypothetical protein